jgi:hypothetical protein
MQDDDVQSYLSWIQLTRDKKMTEQRTDLGLVVDSAINTKKVAQKTNYANQTDRNMRKKMGSCVQDVNFRIRTVFISIAGAMIHYKH